MIWRSRRKSEYSDPFRLSAAGRVRAAIAWTRGPVRLTRWMASVLVVCAVITSVAVVRSAVMHGASPQSAEARTRVRDATATQAMPVDDRLRAGPILSEVLERPGFECQPMPDHDLMYFNPFDDGPIVVAIDANGVVWGPACVVSEGYTSV